MNIVILSTTVKILFIQQSEQRGKVKGVKEQWQSKLDRRLRREEIQSKGQSWKCLPGILPSAWVEKVKYHVLPRTHKQIDRRGRMQKLKDRYYTCTLYKCSSAWDQQWDMEQHVLVINLDLWGQTGPETDSWWRNEQLRHKFCIFCLTSRILNGEKSRLCGETCWAAASESRPHNSIIRLLLHSPPKIWSLHV